MKNLIFQILCVLALFGILAGCGEVKGPVSKPGGLSVGDKAYDFKLMDSQGTWRSLSDVQVGWYTVVLLIRGSWCSACLSQLTAVKEDQAKFAEAGAAVVAISVEPVADLAEFQRQWRFPFPLLSDTGLKVIDAYGARHPKGNEGKDISFSSVIILDPHKIIRYKNVSPDPHGVPHNSEILEWIAKFKLDPTLR